MKRLIGNMIGLIIFLFLLQVAIGMIPAVAAVTQQVFKQLVPNLDLTYSAGEVPFEPFVFPTEIPAIEDTGTPIPPAVPEPTETPAPVESPEPTATPLPEVTVDPAVPTPAPTITWICPILGEGGC
jgi:hypothetical protein